MTGLEDMNIKIYVNVLILLVAGCTVQSTYNIYTRLIFNRKRI